ncbi:hypothetical protein FDP41_006610 [Naegleria fowleri]|uniref:Metallo-beta-lactamase domain-containing protein n=1 Tax=Naegleria fowleri TaxID=5763 RepID=A0A6A5BKB2_NAEFO|nr:uncharacterized protein FDP41_006610 [Naegleria fowleri]KAF0974578.1 hypothetical protein FDP41_006610 [Naegleria fowleri]
MPASKKDFTEQSQPQQQNTNGGSSSLGNAEKAPSKSALASGQYEDEGEGAHFVEGIPIDKTKLTRADIKMLHKDEVKQAQKELAKIPKPEVFANHAELSFFGASGTVTGSKHMVTYGSLNVLIDCGMYQGLKELRERNWKIISSSRPVETMCDAIIITHSHLDHTGYLPRMYALGFNGPIYMTEQTYNLAELILLDSARLQEEDAHYANRKDTTKHAVALPLYTEDEVMGVLKLVRKVKYGEKVVVKSRLEEDKFSFKFFNAGHLLGSSFVEITFPTQEKVIFSGDLGTFKTLSPMQQHPHLPLGADYVVCEATYGGKSHTDFATTKASEDINYVIETKVKPVLKQAVQHIVDNDGVMLIPAFAIGRSQTIAYYLLKMMRDKEIPKLPVHMNSPMSVEALDFYQQHLLEEHQKDAHELLKDVICHNSSKESKDLHQKIMDGYTKCIIISSSGMMTGGRCLFHFEELAPHEKNVVLISGFQAEGTRGRDLLNGVKNIKLHGKTVNVKCQVMQVSGLSAHGDTEDVIKWIEAAKKPKPKMVFVVHGEPNSLRKMAREICCELNLNALVPKRGTTFHMKTEALVCQSRRSSIASTTTSLQDMISSNLPEMPQIGRTKAVNFMYAGIILIALIAFILRFF